MLLGADIDLSKAVTLNPADFDDEQLGSAALDCARKVGWVTANYKFARRTDVYAVLDSNQVDGGYGKRVFMGAIGSQTGLRSRRQQEQAVPCRPCSGLTYPGVELHDRQQHRHHDQHDHQAHHHDEQRLQDGGRSQSPALHFGRQLR